MGLVVHVPAWHLEEDGAVVTVGDHLSTWLEFHESTRWDQPPDRQSRLTGSAGAISSWPGAEYGRHPTVIDVHGAAVYWDAPEPTSGPVDVTGVVSANIVDAPEGFPVTTGIVTRVRMEWQDHEPGDDGAWYPVPGTARYEDLRVSYLPRHEFTDAPARAREMFAWSGVLIDLDVTGIESL